MAVLPTNYLDDILAASMGGKRRFRITHEDGSTEEVTLEDVSEYEQVGSPFGSGDVNKTNQTVNEKLDSADVVDPALATVLGFAADAKLTGDALSELNKNLHGLIGYYNTNDIAVLLSTCTEKVVFFQLNGSNYVGEKPDDNFGYSTGYAIKRDNHYVGEVGYSSKYSFIFKDNTLTFLT